MTLRWITAGFLFLCLSVTSSFAQTSNASVGGFVQDPSQAYIPGVTVTATNTATGVAVTAVTNESGAYNIPSLLPGPINSLQNCLVSDQAFNAVQLGANIAARYNFVLQVGAADQTVEVTAESTALIAESSPTIGQVLTENKVRDLPLVSNNVLDLMKTMPGVQGGIYSANTTFAGISASAVNTTRDGLSVQEGRYAYGVGSTTLMNPDMVGEFRVILAPVDAETGRGNGQVQITTRSGTNLFAEAPYGTCAIPRSTPTPGPIIRPLSAACGLRPQRTGRMSTNIRSVSADRSRKTKRSSSFCGTSSSNGIAHR